MKLAVHTRQMIIGDSVEFCRTIRKVDPTEALNFIISGDYLASQREFYESMFDELGVDPHKARILEVGSGYGFFLVHAQMLGWNIQGIEPGENEFSGRFELAQDILRQNDVDAGILTKSTGENMAFADGTFDVVVSNDVLEHVADPEKVLRESLRVLRPGGVLIFNMPNYNWIYEGHYNIPWIPFLSKSPAKRYVSLWKRDTSYVDCLNFLTPAVIRKYLERIPDAKLCRPLEHKSAEFFSQRIGAYIQAAESRRGNRWLLRAWRLLYAISKNGFCRAALNQCARITGVYHEIHLLLRKPVVVSCGAGAEKLREVASRAA